MNDTRQRLMLYLENNDSPQFCSSKMRAVCYTAPSFYNMCGLCEYGRTVCRLYFQLLKTAFDDKFMIAPREQKR